MMHEILLSTLTWLGDGGSVESNFEHAVLALKRIPRGPRTICCFPESFLYWNVNTAADRLVEESERLLPDLIAAGTGLGGLFIPVLCREGNAIYNVVHHIVGGQIRQSYRKMHPWFRDADLSSSEFDTIPGKNAVAFDSICGPIGVQMCFDVNWEEAWISLARQGCRLILFPSDYPGGFALRVRAWQSCAVVAASVRRGGPSPVIDVTGEVIQDRSPSDNHRVLPLNLNRTRIHLDHTCDKLERLRQKHPEVSVRRLDRDNTFLVVGPREGADIRIILAEYEIWTEQEYLMRVDRVLDKKRSANADS